MNDLSIHPRNWPATGNRKKRNTCDDSSAKKRAAKAMIGVERHIETHPGDAMAKARLSTLQRVIAS